MGKHCDKLLWLDCLGGISVGGIVLAISKLLSRWQNVPVNVVIAMGIANLLYGSFSLYVTTRKPRRLKQVRTLAVANMFWLIVCLFITIAYRKDLSMIGWLLILGEGVYVAGLGFTQWRWQRELTVSN